MSLHKCPSDSTAIKQHCGEANYKRGKIYEHNKAVSNVRVDGTTLHGHCIGGRDEPYQCWATFVNDGGVQQSWCSCQEGDDGKCKHIAAVLIWWLHNNSKISHKKRELSPHTVSDSDLKRRRVGNATPKAHRRVTSPIVVGQDHAHTDRRSETSASPKRTSLKPASPIGEMGSGNRATDTLDQSIQISLVDESQDAFSNSRSHEHSSASVGHTTQHPKQSPVAIESQNTATQLPKSFFNRGLVDEYSSVPSDPATLKPTKHYYTLDSFNQLEREAKTLRVVCRWQRFAYSARIDRLERLVTRLKNELSSMGHSGHIEELPLSSLVRNAAARPVLDEEQQIEYANDSLLDTQTPPISDSQLNFRAPPPLSP